MLKWFTIALLVAQSFSHGHAFAQATELEIFSSPDGAFQFVYPETYDLLLGERMLRATQGRDVGIPVCDFSSALACVIYPIESVQDPHFEAAGFSVRALAGTNESDCLTYADQPEPSPDQHLEVTSVAINNRVFRHTSVRKSISGHTQAIDFYRTFGSDKCFQLQIAVSFPASGPKPAPKSSSLGDVKADSARESLRLILSSVIFQQ